MSHPCSDPWSTLVLSPAENRVTACCESSATGDMLVGEEAGLRPISELWNGPTLREQRRIQTGRQAAPHGCSGCVQSFDAPEQPQPFALINDAGLNEPQRANLERLRGEWRDGAEISTGLPARYVVFFGWACNIRCRICNQVPHRDHFRGRLPAEAFRLWHHPMTLATEVECLGGEPFAIRTGLDFMKAFVADPELAHVPLKLTTNATLLAEHFDWLKAKPNIRFNVSIDSVGEGYEDIRAGGKWADVAANLTEIARLIRTEQPGWQLVTNALFTKTGIRHIVDFARFHVENGIRTDFNFLRPTRGIEETVYGEDVVRYPHLVAEIPDGLARILTAADLYAHAGFDLEAAQMRRLHALIAGSNRPAPAGASMTRPLADIEGEAIVRMAAGGIGGPQPELVEVPGGLGFVAEDGNRGVVLRVNFQGSLPEDGRVLVRLTWREEDGAAPACQATFYDQPDFVLLAWRQERLADGALAKELEVCALGDPAQSKRLMLTLMAGAKFGPNRLPDRLQLLALP